MIDTEILSRLVYKLLCHGIPDIKELNQIIFQNILSNGYIKIYHLLKIINNNKNLLHPITNNEDIEITNKDILKITDLEYFINKIEIQNDFIRSKVNHTLIKIKPELIADELLSKEYIKELNIKIYKKVQTQYLDEIKEKGLSSMKRKTIIFNSSLINHKYSDEEEDWSKIILDTDSMIDIGFNFYVQDDKIICIFKNKNNFFISPNFLIFS